VVHGLAGYFESTLYRPQTGEGKDLVELSILPDQIDKKSKDMVSWFPIFFPLKVCGPSPLLFFLPIFDCFSSSIFSFLSSPLAHKERITYGVG
jgi:hypothetical protein